MSAPLAVSRTFQAPPRRLVQWMVMALCAPTILGVLLFSGLAVLPDQADPSWNPWQPVSAWTALANSLGMLVVFAGFFGSAYGPLLLPFAAGVILRARRLGTPGTGVLWLYIGLGLAATAVSWYWALDAVELP